MSMAGHEIGLRPITFFIPALNAGGAQRVIVNLANAMVDLTDHPIHIALALAEGEFLEEVHPAVEIIDLGNRRASRSIFALSRYLRVYKPVALCSTLNYANVCASLAWLLAGKPCRLVLREANVARAPVGGWINLIRGNAMHWLMRMLYRHADRVVALGENVAATLLERRICEADQIEIIGNPVITQAYASCPGDALMQIQPWRERYIIAVGRLSPQKGFDVLIESFAQLNDDDCDLVILGEGELRAELEAHAQRLGLSDRVHLPGFVKMPYLVIARAQLFVLSSRWEGLPNVLLEALSLGVPVVSTSCPGEAVKVILDGKLGYLVPPEDPDALAVAISEALVLPRGTKDERMNRAADFSAPVIANQYLERAFGLSAK